MTRRLPAVILFALPLGAQTIRVIDFYEPKREKTAEFRAAIGDYNSVMRKAGGTDWYTMWNSLSGPSDYIRIQDYEKWADLDKPPKVSTRNNAELAAVDQRIRDANQSTRRVVMRLAPDASLPLVSQASPAVLIRWMSVPLGHAQESIDLMKSDLLPAVKKSGITDFSIWRAFFGTRQGQIVRFEGIEGWAVFDKPDPVAVAAGDTAYQRFLSKANPLMTEAREDVYRFRPELSYLPPKK